MTATRRAFSLVEVVLALAIFGTGLLMVAAWIGSHPGGLVHLGAREIAGRLVEDVRWELVRHRDAMAGGGERSRLEQLAEGVGTAGLRLVADRSGGSLQLESAADEPGGLARRDRYFLLEVRPQSGPLAYRAGGGFLALEIVIQWPYWLPSGPAADDAVAAPLERTRQHRVPLALTP